MIHSSNGPSILLWTVAITVLTHVTTFYLGLDINIQRLILVFTCCTAAVAVTTCGHSRTEKYVVNFSLGFLTQSVCYNFEISPTVRGVNLAITAFTIYLASFRSPSNLYQPASGNQAIDRKVVTDSTSNGFFELKLWLTCAALVLGIAMGWVLATKASSGNCSVIPLQLDKTHWTVSSSIPGDCDVPTQLRVIEREMSTFMHDILEDVCRVSCIKETSRGRWAGYVSVTSRGVPVDKTYCGEAHSYGDCGDGVARYRNHPY